MVEFSRVLTSQPNDEDARWNLELAWHQANPACHKRDVTTNPMIRRIKRAPTLQAKTGFFVRNADWYTVDSGEHHPVCHYGRRLTQRRRNSRGEPDLYGPSGERPLRSASNGEGKAILGVTGLRENGVYRPESVDPQAEYKYTVRVDVVPPAPSMTEDNDTFDAAKELADGEKGALKACPDDADWYRIKAPKMKSGS